MYITKWISDITIEYHQNTGTHTLTTVPGFLTHTQHYSPTNKQHSENAF